ncbi:hypothetical protein BROUX41_000208 [Berkeleyomyces rouxiae]|uniref:uncharacterized protein n=1 Tax=Berkeleyomyces rouxiae TaxID=2035830 RepID=UPI003B80F811
MLIPSTFFAALATAASIPKRTPAETTSTGVRFKVNFVSGSDDLKGVDKTYLHGLHSGAGYNYASFKADGGFTFFKNVSSTDESRNSLISSWPPLTINFLATAEDGGSQVMISAATANDDVQVVKDDASLYLAPITWAACTVPLEGLLGGQYTVLKNYEDASKVPEACATIDLVPYCAELPAFPTDEAATKLNFHPQEIPCYSESA